MRVIHYFLIVQFLLSCSSSKTGRCDGFSEEVKMELSGLFNKTEDSASVIKRWTNLTNFLCSEIANNNFLIIEKKGNYYSSPLGVIYIPEENKCYYFKKKGKKNLLIDENTDVKPLRDLAVYLLSDFEVKSKKIISAISQYRVYDAPSIDVLFIDLKSKKKSSFFFSSL